MNERQRFRFPKAQRLHLQRDFARLYRRGRRLQTGYFRVFFEERGEGPVRLGLSVSKKLGSAVRRNRIKRLIREWVRLHQQELAGLDLVIQPQRELAALDQQALWAQLGDLGDCIRKARSQRT